MRLPLLIATAMSVATPAFAADKPAVDLVAGFVLGIEDGSIAGNLSEPGTSVMKETSPGVFEGMAVTGPAFSFAVADKGACVFEIAFKVKGEFVAGIALDANKLSGVTYEQTGSHDGLFGYKITMLGAPDIVAFVDAEGAKTPTDQASSMATSLTVDQMQASLAAFQADYCPAAS